MSERTKDSATPASPSRRENEHAAVPCVSATHAILFEAGDECCSVCAQPLEVEDDESTEVRGRGLLIWTRGEERRYEEPHLCPACASAIGVTALQRWEIEEDEG
ncbi:MAG TPA: hypothetical protein VM580_28085 [Labilithrix sp.]|jgi:hypothetical protein|nr:hypothetical protein [Labilithrix sp.]